VFAKNPFALLALLAAAAGFVPVWAEESRPVKKRILEFPADKKVARIFFCREKKKHPGEIEVIKEASRPAIGSIILQNNEKIALEATWDGAEDLSWLSKLKPDDIQVLDLHKLPVSKKGMSYVARQTGLKYLFLEDTEIEDGDLEPIGQLSNLIELRISKTAVKGAGLRYLCPLKKLEKLDLGHLDLDEKTIANLECLHSLKDLDLGNCGLKDDCLKQISKITSLKALSLRGNEHISDKKLSQLSSLKNLWNLNLSDTNISNNAGKELKSLPKLGTLRLGGQKFARLDPSAIGKQLPGCHIIFAKGKDDFAKMIFSPLH